jgi:NADH-quinone oxidoreductase subunit J
VAGSTTGGRHSNVYVLGKSIFTTYLFAFEATAALLVIAVVGAVVLARRPRVEDAEPEPGEPPEAPVSDASAARREATQPAPSTPEPGALVGGRDGEESR